jgi:hypothetical protein
MLEDAAQLSRVLATTLASFSAQVADVKRTRR